MKQKMILSVSSLMVSELNLNKTKKKRQTG